MQFFIQRRANADSPWQATKHIIEADTANGALRKFGLRDAFTSDRVKIAAGGKTGRQYRAVTVQDSEPVKALKRNVSGKVAAGKAEPVVAVEAPYGLKADGTPKRKPGRKPASNPKVTVKSNHSDKVKGGTYTREMRIANLEKARAARAAKRAAANNGSAPSLSDQEKHAAELMRRLEALKAEILGAGSTL
jgi:hypothetical protein